MLGCKKRNPTYAAKDLVTEIEKAGIPAIQSKQQLGTFVVKELVYSYAMWISPVFSLKVIRAYDALVNAKPYGLKTLPYQTELFSDDHISISKDDYIDLLKIKLAHLETAKPAAETKKARKETRKWFWTQAEIDALNQHVKNGLANWKIAELTGRSEHSIRTAVQRYAKGGAA